MAFSNSRCFSQNLLPINKRSADTFEKHFKEAGLGSIVDYQRAKASAEVKRELQKEVEEMMKEEEPVKEVMPSYLTTCTGFHTYQESGKTGNLK